MLERGDADSVAEILSAFADGITAAERLQRCFGISQQESEIGYRKFLNRVVEGSSLGERKQQPNFVDLQTQLRQRPDDPESLARMAYATFYEAIRTSPVIGRQNRKKRFRQAYGSLCLGSH